MTKVRIVVAILVVGVAIAIFMSTLGNRTPVEPADRDASEHRNALQSLKETQDEIKQMKAHGIQ